MRITKGRCILALVCVGWVLVIGTGLGLLWSYENAPGEAATPPAVWPCASRIPLAKDRATLVMLVHPHCPCSRASVGELDRLMAQAQGRVTAYALFLKPPDAPDDWEKTGLWQHATSIPGVTAIVDEDGVEAQRFCARTSGQTLLYSPAGQLLFSGGITGSRGHSGDNAGRSAIVALLQNGETEAAKTFVYGCPLFAPDSQCKGGSDEPPRR